jgi:hypothetical protein
MYKSEEKGATTFSETTLDLMTLNNGSERIITVVQNGTN